MRAIWLFRGTGLTNLITKGVLALAFGGVVAASCSFNPGPPGSAPATGSTTGGPGFGGSGPLGVANSSGTTGIGTGAAGTVGSTGAAGSGPSPDGSNCGLQQYGLQNVPPDLLIVEDKSGSMANDLNDNMCMQGAMCETKWADTVAGIEMVTAMTDTTIRWGLKYFANDRGCGVMDGAAVPIGPNNAMPIATSLNMTMPGGSTPTRLAINSAVTYLQGVADPNPKFILLATDGEPNCAPGARAQDDDAAGAVAAVMAANMAGIPVFVAGVGNVATAQATLDMLAVAGGKPQATEPKYYPVGSTADLVNVLKTIGGMIASCSFGLGQVPPDPTNVGVYANGQTGMKIPRDVNHVNGWDYGAGMKSIVLYGAACDAVKNKTTMTIQAIFGCPGVIIP
jgi:hypothetical protein